MKATIKLQDTDFTLQSKPIGTSKKFTNGTVFKYRIFVTEGENKTSFIFHTSLKDFANMKRIDSAQELAFALYCFISDACVGNDSFEEMCDSLGYDYYEDSSERVYKLCVKAKEKFDTLTDLCMYELLGELQEKYNC
jgi:hypothetical protein